MRLISANVNGVRAAKRRGGLDWLAGRGADVIALQEVRATTAQVRAELAGTPFEAWHLTHAESDTAGRAGVAVLSRREPVRTAFSLDVPPPEVPEWSREHLVAFATSGRWVEVDLPTSAGVVTVVSAYMPKGAADGPRHEAKLAFLEGVAAWFDRAARPFVVVGDVNVAHTPDDLKNAKGNIDRPGCMPVERAYLDRWQASGVVDVQRRLRGAGPGPYTWWSWRGKAFDNDAGWRIDYHLASPDLAAVARDDEVGRAATYDARWSDHAAVSVDYVM